MITQNQIQTNLETPAVELMHQALKRSDNESLFKSICPFCNEPGLFVIRNKKFHLLKHDRCMMCVREVCYTDIKENSITLEYI